ncbi:MAG: hypothetical protein CENE_01784 [Candidatus Celerinatantimonas neptuna]|nr:MAG: hypothetical protein CENE_01784 [Candidatus Celerinatantimonas neptuna]
MPKSAYFLLLKKTIEIDTIIDILIINVFLMDISPATWLLLRLVAVPGLGPVKIQQLLEFSDIGAIGSADAAELRKMGLTDSQVLSFLNGCSALERAVFWLERSPQHHILGRQDPDYPVLLNKIASAPPVLFVKGDPALLHLPQIAVVGSRHASYVALEQTRRFACELCEAGLTVTSGLALGIDAAAHQGALLKGNTIAVMGTGPDSIYPARHRRLAEQICEQGALVSEFFPGTAPKAQHFPRRNRLISGLSIGVLISEAARKSGSLITAKYALEQNREIFAIPGNIDNPLTEGPHLLIQQGAKLVTNLADILEELAPFMPDILDKVGLDLDNSHHQRLPTGGLLDNVGYEMTTVDQVVERSLLPVNEVIRQLIELEISGEVAAVSGGYVRLRRNP